MAAEGFPTIPTPEEEEDNREGLPKGIISTPQHLNTLQGLDMLYKSGKPKEKFVFFKTNKSVFFKTKPAKTCQEKLKRKDGSFERRRRSQDGLHHEDRPTSTAG